jgi:DNA polymerase IV
MMCLILVTTGELQRLKNLDKSDHTVELFMGVYGIGRSTALRFVMQGFRTLKDLLERGELTQSQRIGIELYNVSPTPSL